jgi:glycosyltransferase involved in cell wall biosynthesis
MRLLYVIDSLAPGGAETSLADMAPGLVRSGIDLHILPLGSRLDLAPALQDAGAVLHARQATHGRLGNVRAVMKVSGRIHPHLVHTTLYESDVAGRTAARLLRVPSSTSIVNDSYDASHYAESSTARLHMARAVDALTARSARRFHAVTAAIADSVSPRLGIPRDKVDIIPRGRDPQAFPFRPAGRRESTRRALSLPLSSPVILAIGRLEPQKGLHHLLEAVPEVAQDHPGLVVLIAGKEGRSSPDLRATAARLKIDVRFLGHRTDIVSLLAAADVLCFPSEREGFGGALLEAMAVGCPIVASAIPTSLEVLGSPEGGVGMLAPVADSRQLAAHLGAVLSDDALARRMARRGRDRFEQHFTTHMIAQRMAAFFDAAARTT